MKKKLNAGLGMVVSKRSIAPLIVFAFAQTACDEDPDAWADIVVDGGLDGSVTVGSDASTGESSTGSTQDTVGLTVDVDTTEDEVRLDASIDDTTGESEVDASVTSAPTGPAVTSEDTSAETSEPVSTGSTAVATSETSATPTSANPTSETPTSETSTSEAPTSETLTTGPASETSAPTGGETSTVEVSSSETTSDSSDAGAPALLVCGDVINEAEAISLEAALANYPVQEVDAGAGDAGTVFADCYPPCVAALLHACPAGAMDECATEYDGPYNVAACWDNGVSQVLDYQYDDYFAYISQAAYNGGSPCVSGTRTINYESGVSTYVWYDGTGALVATGTDESYELVVTCTEDSQAYTVDRYACPWLGDVVYSQLDCGLDSGNF